MKLFGQDFQVIGYLESEGDNAFNFINFDDVLWLNFNCIKKYVNVKDESSVGRLLNIKAKPNVDLEDLKGEITGIIRAERRQKPLEKNSEFDKVVFLKKFVPIFEKNSEKESFLEFPFET